MNAPHPTLELQTGALRGDLRPCETSPRPIPSPPEPQLAPIGEPR